MARAAPSPVSPDFVQAIIGRRAWGVELAGIFLQRLHAEVMPVMCACAPAPRKRDSVLDCGETAPLFRVPREPSGTSMFRHIRGESGTAIPHSKTLSRPPHASRARPRLVPFRPEAHSAHPGGEAGQVKRAFGGHTEFNLKTAVERSKPAKTPDFPRVFNGSAAHFSSDNPMCHKRLQSKSTRQSLGLQPPF